MTFALTGHRIRNAARGAVLASMIALGLVAPGQAVAAEAEARNPDGVAVVIGNRSYRGDVPSVDFAHRDAEAMKRYVIDVLGYREGNVIFLEDATQAQLFSVFGGPGQPRGKLYQYVRPGESDVVVYYSGHGVPGVQDRKGYLLPVDASPATSEINGYSLDVLSENLNEIGARSVTVFIDACFSGASPNGALIKNASPFGIKVELPKQARQFALVTAASGDQLASWDTEAKHGLFTEYLMQGLYGKADTGRYGNGDGRVTLAELRNWLDREMTYAARRNYNRQQKATVSGPEETVLVAWPGGMPPERPQIAEEAQVAALTPPTEARDDADPEKAAAAAEDALGLTREDRGAVQRGLTALGHGRLVPDGLFGSGTRGVVKRYQRAVKADVTGYLTADQASTLMAEGEKVAAREVRTGATGPGGATGGRGPQIRVTNVSGINLGFAAESQLTNLVRSTMGPRWPEVTGTELQVSRIETRQEADPSAVGAQLFTGLLGAFTGQRMATGALANNITIATSEVTAIIQTRSGDRLTETATVERYDYSGSPNVQSIAAAALGAAARNALARANVRLSGGSPPSETAHQVVGKRDSGAVQEGPSFPPTQ